MGIRKIDIGDKVILATDDELESSGDYEVSVEDLNMNREDKLQAKRRAYRALFPDEVEQRAEDILYKKYTSACRKKKVFPTFGSKAEFLDLLYSVPVTEPDGKVIPFAIAASKRKGISRISPRQEGIVLYYRDSIVYSNI